ncbi:hypothetical protein [Luteitalea sp.]
MAGLAPRAAVAVLTVLLVLAAGVVSGRQPAPATSSASPSVCEAASAAPRVDSVPVMAVARLTLSRCARQDLDEGRWRDADRRLGAARAAAALVPVTHRQAWRALVVRLEATRLADAGRWADLGAVVLPDEEVLPWVGPLLRGVATARASWAQQDADLQARARAELVRLDALARQAGPLSPEEHARLLVQAAMAGAQYERDEMQLLLDAAHDLERRLMADDEFRWPVILARELEGDLLLTTDRPAAASERYRDLLVEWPRRVQSRIGLAAAYRRQGFVREADETLAQARALWADADPDAIALVR